jgi:Acyl-protein synthetase, LuxE
VSAADALDARILGAIAGWHAGGPGLDEPGFNRLALDLFDYQLVTNGPYRRFVEAQFPRRPRNWREIPAVPSTAFKDATLATFPPEDAELEFHTSGTTASKAGRHFVERAALYDAALLAGFDRFMLADGARLMYLCLVPDPEQHPHSSLGYMMRAVLTQRGAPGSRFCLNGDSIDFEGFLAGVASALAMQTPVCVAGTAFAFVALSEALEAQGAALQLPSGSRVMETGGFKGRTRAIERDELYERIARSLGIPRECIVAEYGMTELCSQYYDASNSRRLAPRIKTGPPWLRALTVDADGREVAPGETGFLRHVDLANRSSVIAIQTEDRGYLSADGFVLLGRDRDAPLRGCSLDAEELAAGRG